MSPQQSQSANYRRKSSHRARSGFSLVELMVVIIVIAILAALLLPALGNISATAQITQVKVEISGFESDITNFKTEFGIGPPSSIILTEDGSASGAWASVPSKTLIRRLWPQFNFAGVRDINGDGDTDDVIEMTGAECLVFFLGGVMATTDASETTLVNAAGTTNSTGVPAEWSPLGFSKNPRDPFERGGGTRIGPFHEFDGARLVNLFSITSTDQGMPEYLDTLPSQSKPYLYASSYDGRGYNATDLGNNLATPLVDVTTMDNVYLQKDDVAAIGDPSEVAWKQTGFQIISPGLDGEYGIGGLYDPDKVQQLTGNRSEERDNITNFSSGQLAN